jgi:uncharacterized protein YydD (DUF2326 family)
MKLNRLAISRDGVLIREVIFKSALNLVLNRRGAGRSGNSVGKSTLSRVIDYIFLGSISPIYIDEEFKKPNEKIESLFTKSRVEAQLEFLGIDNKIHVATRNLTVSSSDRTYHVDGQELTEFAYEELIQRLFFDVSTKRPSVRFLAPKFIRNDNHKMLNTTKFLDPHVGAKDYSEVFLYLFGFQNTALLTEKRDASNLAGKRKKYSTALNAIVKEQKPASEVGKYRGLAQDLERDLLRFDYSPEYVDPISRLSELQLEENEVTERSLDVERRIANISRTMEILNEQGGNYLVNEVRAIYEFAGVSVESAIKSFEEVLSFHDKLVARKLQFITSDLPDLTSTQSELRYKLENIQQKKLSVFADIRSTDSIINITEKIKELGELKVKLGKLEGLLEQQQTASNDVAKANDALRAIAARIFLEMDSVVTFVAAFNKHFKRITQLTHAEPYEFILKFDDETGMCQIEIKNKVSNPEGGKKKAEVIAFDMAYIFAVSELQRLRPTFVFHDSIEDIDQKQIEAIFASAKTLPGQQVISMLSDKLSDEMYQKYLPDAILLLSEDDMFFGI